MSSEGAPPHALFEGGGERIHIVLVPLKGTTVGDPTRELKYSCTWLYSAWLPRGWILEGDDTWLTWILINDIIGCLGSWEMRMSVLVYSS